MKIDHLNSLHSLVKSSRLFGRYITNLDIELCFKQFPSSITSVIGYSVEKRPIYSLRFGNGPIKVLMWSQMHGNESTTTKALFDCFNLFFTNNAIPNAILEACTIVVIPILNPDGAQRYTRLNANGVDLNRDAQTLSQPESKVLRDVFNTFKPQYCFNLHGQRTIYNVGDTSKSSVLSFLAPAQDTERSITANRKVAMEIIAEINAMLQQQIPNNVARYDDSFNLNCVGDTFQSFGVPTVLYEAGHYPGDYDREVVRNLVFMAIIKGLTVISNGVNGINYTPYFNIPDNNKQFYDIIIRNARVINPNSEVVDIAIQFEERLNGSKIEFVPIVEAISKLDNYFGHKEIDAKAQLVKTEKGELLKVGFENDFVRVGNEEIILNL